MIHLELDSLIDKLTGTDKSYCQHIRDINKNVITGYISVDDTLWNPFTDINGNHYYVIQLTDFGENYKECNDNYRYSIRMYGNDDGILCREIHSVDEFYQWIKLFEFRDFTHSDIEKYVDDVY